MDILQIIVIGASVLLATTISSITGFGSSFVVIAALSLFFSIKVSVALFAIISIVSSASKVIVYSRTIDFDFLKILVIGLVPGLLIGLALFKIIPERPIEIMIGLLGIYLIFEHFISMPKVSNFTNKKTIFWGFVLGLIGGTGSAGTIRAMILKWKGMDKFHLVGSSAALGVFMGIIQSIAFTAMGFVQSSQIMLLIPVIILSMVGASLGKKFLKSQAKSFLKLQCLL